MIPSLLSFLTFLFRAVGKIFDYLHAKQLVDVGRTQQQLEALRHEVTNAQIAVAAREAIRRSTLAEPDRLPERDPFLRD